AWGTRWSGGEKGPARWAGMGVQRAACHSGPKRGSGAAAAARAIKPVRLAAPATRRKRRRSGRNADEGSVCMSPRMPVSTRLLEVMPGKTPRARPERSPAELRLRPGELAPEEAIGERAHERALAVVRGAAVAALDVL